MSRSILTLSFIALLAACGDEGEPAQAPPRDPQVAQALDDPLMTDPDLASRNEAAAALTVSSDASLPVLPATPEAIAAAREEAAKLVGGARLLVDPGEPTATGLPLPRDARPRDRLAALLGSGDACADKLQVSAIWAARLPPAMPIYPRGNTIEAAGSDAPGCRFRTVEYATPVSPTDVMAFYHALARKAGGDGPPLMQAGDDLRLRGGARGSLSYDIYARAEGDRTIVRLTTFER